MKISAIVCFVIAAISTLVAIKNVAAEANHSGGMTYLVSYAVGSFIIPFVFLIGGLAILEKSKKSK